MTTKLPDGKPSNFTCLQKDLCMNDVMNVAMIRKLRLRNLPQK